MHGRVETEREGEAHRLAAIAERQPIHRRALKRLRDRRIWAPAAIALAIAFVLALGSRTAAPGPEPAALATVETAADMTPPARAAASLTSATWLNTAGNDLAQAREAVQRLWPLAAVGDPRAQWHLARAYAHGLGIEKDFCRSAYWLDRAARNGEARAQLALGYAFLPPNGMGIEADAVQAYRWAAAAAAQGLVLAQERLGGFRRILSPEQRAMAEEPTWRPLTAAPAQIARYPYIPVVAGIWPRLLRHSLPCRAPGNPPWPSTLDRLPG